jgi:hypothetical protein
VSHTWFDILEAALKMPGARVERALFLKKTFSFCCDTGTVGSIIKMGAEAAGVETGMMEDLADGVINRHVTKATLASALAGIPGGLAMAATIPADVVQFYYHVIVAAQEIAYIYGFKSVEESDFKEFLTLLIAQMMGIAESDTAFKELAAAQFATKLGAVTLGKILDKTVSRIAVSIGIQLGKKNVLKALTKAVPLIGGAVSGAVTFTQLKPMCGNLKNKLRDSVEIKRARNVTEEE